MRIFVVGDELSWELLCYRCMIFLLMFFLMVFVFGRCWNVIDSVLIEEVSIIWVCFVCFVCFVCLYVLMIVSLWVLVLIFDGVMFVLFVVNDLNCYSI